MLWFNGSVREAVDKVKSSGVLLLVFVQGDDALSGKYEKYLSEEEKFNLDDYVAIKIPHKSVAFEHFKQIYISVPVPSVFLIQNNGIPLRVVSSSEVADIHSAISDVISKQKLKEEGKNKMHFTEVVSQCENKDHFRAYQAATQHFYNAFHELATSDAKRLYRKTYISNIIGEQQSPLELWCQIADDTDDKSVPNLRQLQHVKNIGRRITNITEEEVKKRLVEIRAFPKFWLMSDDASPFPKPISIQKSARIQFRLPNNKMPSWEFPGLSTLKDVREYLKEKMKLSSDFKLLRAYPRSPFTPQDESKTLSELALTPSATLIVVPVQDKTVQAKIKTLIARQSFLSMVLGTVFQPFFSILNYIKERFFKWKSEKKENGPKRLPSDNSVEKVFNKKTSTNNIHSFKFEEDTDTET